MISGRIISIFCYYCFRIYCILNTKLKFFNLIANKNVARWYIIFTAPAYVLNKTLHKDIFLSIVNEVTKLQ